MKSIKLAISLRQALLTFIPASLLLIGIVIIGSVHQISMATFTRDVTTLADLIPIAGILSTSGILVWGFTFAICAFTSVLLYRLQKKESYLFMLGSTLLTGYLLFDDGFLFHDYIAPYYLGLHEWQVYLLLVILVAAYIVFFRKPILKTNLSFFLLAGVFLGASLFVDVIFEDFIRNFPDWEYLLEDGLKWLGIVCWCSYFIGTCLCLIIDAVQKEKVIV